MAKTRRKTEAVLRDFNLEVNRLKKFDAYNQKAFSSGSSSALTKKHLHFLVEYCFFTGFRAYENFLRDIFLLYSLEKSPKSGRRVNSYLKPKSFEHAELLIQSSMPFLDWATPSTVVARAELYLVDGFPIKDPITHKLVALRDFKTIRNHIAHNSKESLGAYIKVVRKHFKTIPLTIPSPGEYLLESDKKDAAKYLLLAFFDTLQSVAENLSN